MRLLAAVAAAVVLALGVASAVGHAQAPAKYGPVTFVVTGGGWGHGVGMSQWGAYGQALEGRTYRDILAWYYRGTQLGTASLSRLRVLLKGAAKKLTISSPVPFRVRDAAATTHELAAGEVAFGPGLKLPVDGKPKPTALAGPLVFLPGKGAQLQLGGAAYRGELVVSREGKRLSVVNTVGLEGYLRGVVAREMPKDWPLEALKAQAVAARTYSLARFLKGKPFDLYADVRSQVYGGVAAEAPRATEAVRATAGQVVLYGGAPTTTFYFSSSGGRTANGEDVLGVALPYLVSVPDPWDKASPNHAWPARLITGAAVTKAFGLPSQVADAISEPTPSGRPKSVTLTTRAGTTVSATGTDVRTRLGLLSQNFRLGVLRLDPPTAPAAAGQRLRLTGVARGVADATLERLGTGGWERAARIPVRADGAFAVDVKPDTDTRYRLTASGLAGPPLLVRVGAAGA
jgi:SpoIID/LytB domain protein